MDDLAVVCAEALGRRRCGSPMSKPAQESVPLVAHTAAHVHFDTAIHGWEDTNDPLHTALGKNWPSGDRCGRSRRPAAVHCNVDASSKRSATLHSLGTALIVYSYQFGDLV